jgi:hypothetical protein
MQLPGLDLGDGGGGKAGISQYVVDDYHSPEFWKREILKLVYGIVWVMVSMLYDVRGKMDSSTILFKPFLFYNRVVLTPASAAQRARRRHAGCRGGKQVAIFFLAGQSLWF